ncbi:17-beta-hydroxysteroid dehydrogenase type 2-like [Gastrophryne carolinensis]
MGTERLYVAVTAVLCAFTIHKLVKNKVKMEHASVCALLALFLLEIFCYFACPIALGVSVFASACVLYYITLPVTQMLPAAGKSVLITGCDSGLGHELAKRLDERGVQVFAGVLDKNGPGAEELTKICSPNLCLIQLDVTNPEQITRAYQEIFSHAQDTGLWGIVHNAGVLCYVADGELLPISVYKQCMEVNFIGVVQVTKTFLPLLRKAKGRLVAISSMAGHTPLPGFAAYAASKAALSMFSAVMRQDLLKWGVQVSAVYPSGFKTKIFGSQEHVSSQAQNLLDTIMSDVKNDYGEEYLTALKNQHQYMFTNSASDPSPFLEDICHALLAWQPYPFYTPGRFAYLIPCLYRYFPLWVYDTFVKLIFNNHRNVLPRSLRISHNNNYKID